MNNEPVAWIDKVTGKPRMVGWIQTDYDIPLYTHPAKTLTGLTAEERKAIWVGIWSHYSCPSVDDIFAEIEEAILRKANEK